MLMREISRKRSVNALYALWGCSGTFPHDTGAMSCKANGAKVSAFETPMTVLKDGVPAAYGTTNKVP